MNFAKALDLITETDNKITAMEEAKNKLRLALAAKAELDNGAKAKIMLICGEGVAPMNIDELLTGNNFTAEVRQKIDEIALKQFLILSKHNNKGEGAIELETPKPPAIVPELESLKLETPETPKAEPVKKGIKIPDKIIDAKIKDEHGRAIVNRKVLAQMYFKDGKGAKQIARETGLAESTVFRHLSEMKAEKEKAAKECARQV